MVPEQLHGTILESIFLLLKFANKTSFDGTKLTEHFNKSSTS